MRLIVAGNDGRQRDGGWAEQAIRAAGFARIVEAQGGAGHLGRGARRQSMVDNGKAPPADLVLDDSARRHGRATKWLTLYAAILNLHERIENKLFLNRTRKDSNFKRPHICATLFQIEKCCVIRNTLVERAPGQPRVLKNTGVMWI